MGAFSLSKLHLPGAVAMRQTWKSGLSGAVWAMVTLAFILALPLLYSTVAFSAVISISTVGLYISCEPHANMLTETFWMTLLFIWVQAPDLAALLPAMCLPSISWRTAEMHDADLLHAHVHCLQCAS